MALGGLKQCCVGIYVSTGEAGNRGDGIWVECKKEHRKNLYSDDKKGLGYDDYQIYSNYFKMKAALMNAEVDFKPGARGSNFPNK